MPRRWRRARSSRSHRMPSTSTLPPVASVSPSRISTVVVLPAPLGPSRPKHSPRGTSRSRPSTATSSPYFFTSLSRRSRVRRGRRSLQPRLAMIAVALAARFLLLLLHLLHRVALEQLLADGPQLRLLHAVVGEEVLESVGEQHAAVVARDQVLGQRQEGLESHAGLHRIAQLADVLVGPEDARLFGSGQLAGLELDAVFLLQGAQGVQLRARDQADGG